MGKDTFYFTHDYNARGDEKIKLLLKKHGLLGYGLYWAIVEDLYNNSNALRLDYESIAYDLRTDEELVRSVINDFGLFEINEELFGSASIERRINHRNEKAIKAKESASLRWNKMRSQYDNHTNVSKNDANVMRTHYENDANALKNDANASDSDTIAMRTHEESIRSQYDRNANASKNDAIKERKGKEIKERKGDGKEEFPPPPVHDEKISLLPSGVILSMFGSQVMMKAKNFGIPHEKIPWELKKFDEFHIETAFTDAKHTFNSWGIWCSKWREKNLVTVEINKNHGISTAIAKTVNSRPEELW
jgi:hypothetical protein